MQSQSLYAMLISNILLYAWIEVWQNLEFWFLSESWLRYIFIWPLGQMPQLVTFSWIVNPASLGYLVFVQAWQWHISIMWIKGVLN